MQPVLVHHCTLCSHDTSVPFSASVFSQNQACSHCGSISVGVNVKAQQSQKEKEMANMQQEELARLFSANMNLSHAPAPSFEQPPPYEQHQQHAFVQQEQQPQQQEQEQAPNPQPITYISQHYTHTHHVVPVRHISQQAEATQSTSLNIEDLQNIMLRNQIDLNGLFPSQIDLFVNADNDQRDRLLELWRISPPQGRQGIPSGMDYNMSRQLYDWPPTSLAQEESMAKLRYQKLMEEQAQQDEIRRHQEQLDQSMAGPSSATDTGAEPYVVSGYEMMARREYEESAKATENALRESKNYNQATDPVYNAHSGVWEKNVGSVLDMENQYGAFAAAREHGGHHIYEDAEMVM